MFEHYLQSCLNMSTSNISVSRFLLPFGLQGYEVEISMVTTNETTVVETVSGLFTRRDLTTADAPLMSINCTHNCGPEMWIVERTMTFVVRVLSNMTS